MECWVAGGGIPGLFDCTGRKINDDAPPSCNFGLWWDGDFLRELLDKTAISKWNWENATAERLLTADGCGSNNGTKATPCLSADILGDWREELIWRTDDNQSLRIYVTEHRLVTLMHDPEYRLSIVWQNVAYNQPPHTGFYLGDGMEVPPRPNISTGKVTEAEEKEAVEGEEAPKSTPTARPKIPAPTVRKKVKRLEDEPGALLVIKPFNSEAQLVRAQNAIVQGGVVMADLGGGKRGVWESDIVKAQLPWFTEEELQSGDLDLEALMAKYQVAAMSHATIKTPLAVEIAKIATAQEAARLVLEPPPVETPTPEPTPEIVEEVVVAVATPSPVEPPPPAEIGVQDMFGQVSTGHMAIMGAIGLVGLLLLFKRGARTFGIILLIIFAAIIFLFIKSHR